MVSEGSSVAVMVPLPKANVWLPVVLANDKALAGNAEPLKVSVLVPAYRNIAWVGSGVTLYN